MAETGMTGIAPEGIAPGHRRSRDRVRSVAAAHCPRGMHPRIGGIHRRTSGPARPRTRWEPWAMWVPSHLLLTGSLYYLRYHWYYIFRSSIPLLKGV